jgi:O-antigen/teichoic acid export membrane protein
MSQTGTPAMAKSILFRLFGNVLAPLASIATAPLLAHGLAVDARGEVAAATAPLLLATAVGGFGIPEAINFFVARRRAALRPVVVRALIGLAALGVLVSIGVYAAAGPLSSGNAHLADLIRLTAAASGPTLLALIPRMVAAGCHQWGLLAVESAVAAVLRLGWIGALFASSSLTAQSATVALLATPLVSVVLLMPFLLRTWRGLTPQDPADQVSWSDLAGFGVRVWLGALSGIVLTRLSAVLMVPLSDEFQAGLFAVAVSIGEIPLLISGSVRDVIFSADASGGDDARLQQMSRLTTLVTFVLSLFLAVTISFWLPLLFGRDYSGATPTALVVLAATVIGSTGSVAGAGLSARGHPGLRSWSMFFGAIANFTVLVVTVPIVGALGGGLAMLAGSTIAGTGNVVWLNRRFAMPFGAFYGVRGVDIDLARRSVASARQRFGRASGSAAGDWEAPESGIAPNDPLERPLHLETEGRGD